MNWVPTFSKVHNPQSISVVRQWTFFSQLYSSLFPSLFSHRTLSESFLHNFFWATSSAFSNFYTFPLSLSLYFESIFVPPPLSLSLSLSPPPAFSVPTFCLFFSCLSSNFNSVKVVFFSSCSSCLVLALFIYLCSVFFFHPSFLVFNSRKKLCGFKCFQFFLLSPACSPPIYFI